MAERLVLIDSNSLIYRAFFAVPPLTTTKGELANATFGFASILLKSLEQTTPQHIAAAFDLPVPTFRHERDAAYKATRRPMPDELRPQFERVKQLLDAFGVPMYSLPGYEADDVIGALSRQAEAKDLETIIVSGDLDPLQLVTARVKLMTTRQGFQNTVIYDEELIRQRYGLRPDQMVDFKALKGDATDNIPGVPGVGEKTAAKLIVEHGNLEGVYADLSGYTPRLREELAANREQVFRSRELATIVTDLPVTLDLERTRRSTYDRAAVLELFRDLEFRSLVPRLPPADQNIAAPAPTSFAPSVPRGGQMQLGLEAAPAAAALVETTLVADADEAARELRKATALAVHADVDATTGQPLLVGIGLAAGERAWYVPTPDGVPGAIAAVLRDENIPKTAHDGKTARRALRRAGTDLGGLAMDTMIASYLVNASRRYHALEDLAAERLRLEVPVLPVPDRKDPYRTSSLEERRARAGAGAVAAARLGELFAAELERLNLVRLYRDVELPLVDVLVEMEEAGIAVDLLYLRSLGEEFAREVARIEQEAYTAVGHDFGINSPKQLQSLLFEELKLPRGRRTGTGYSTDATVLDELRGAHPVVDKILEYREIEKLRSTYAEGLGGLVDPETRRVHTTFEQTVAATGRLSSRAPNLQNIPIRTPLGRRIRRAFVAGSPDLVLVAADYSQIELRVLAHVSQDPALLDAFRSGADIHRRTAAAGFGVAESAVTREQRDVAKMLNFGIVYGMSDFGLAWRMKMPREEAERFIDEYFKRYGQVRRYVLETKAFCIEQGYVETLLGRRRYIPDMTSRVNAVRNAAERMAINMPIQGTAADIMKIAMSRVHRALHESGMHARVLLQVHDELVAEVPRAEVDRMARLLGDEMSASYELDVPLVVDVRVGPNWDEMQRLEVPAAANA
ncbi:MAG TPA: DNA polymerase I [Candidatus Limnocylindria bacterium]|jgi:DNA polymerase-1|nr:DNA polymerase I [Candidatus Limnocylindria bacterium]